MQKKIIVSFLIVLVIITRICIVNAENEIEDGNTLEIVDENSIQASEVATDLEEKNEIVNTEIQIENEEQTDELVETKQNSDKPNHQQTEMRKLIILIFMEVILAIILIVISYKFYQKLKK